MFISHANPGDNDVAGWLACKLSVLGFNVWVDVEKLKGGETIWRVIEAVLRSDARTLILILSKSSFDRKGQLKQGISNELSLALTLEKEHERFVYPWIVDDIGFGQLPIELQGRLSVGTPRWSQALGQILEYLESIGVQVAEVGRDSGLLSKLLVPNSCGVTAESCTYELNRISNVSLPSKVFSIDQDAPALIATQAVFQGRRLSFSPNAGPAKLFGHDQPKSLDTSELLANGCTTLGMTAPDVRRVIVELTNKTLQDFLRSKGLVEKWMARRNPVFFFNSVTVPSAKLQVSIPWNRTKSYRNVCGRHGELYWHLGMEFVVSYPDNLTLTLIPHICFTKDGISLPLSDNPEADKKLQHRHRRAISKLWFNDKWLGFYYAFMVYLAGDNQEVVIPVTGNTALSISSNLAQVIIPARHTKVESLLPDDDPAEHSEV